MILNKENIGWRKSFYKAILSSNGDVIFLCDQDDIWKESKIKEMYDIINGNKEIGLLVCGYDVFYEDLVSEIDKHSYNCNSKNTGNVIKINLNKKFMYVAYPGCTYAFTKEFFMSIKKYWNDKFAHDAILWRYSLVKEKAYRFDKNLICWRRHSSSSSSVKNVLKNNVNKNKRELLMRINLSESRIAFLYDLLKMIYNEHNSDDKADLIEECIKFEKKYLTGLRGKSILKILALFIVKSKYFLSYKTVLGDIRAILMSKFEA